MANGVTLSYHRIALIDIDVNQQITLLVESYIDEDGRNYQKAYENSEIEGEPTFPYTNAQYINLSYDESSKMLTSNIIKESYNFLKEYNEFKGATDV